MPSRVLKIIDISFLKWLIGFFTVIIIQISILRYFALVFVPNTPIQPDLVLLFLFFFGIRHSQIVSTLMGFGVGFLLDALGGGMLGLHALTKTVAGFIIGYIPEAHKIQKMAQFCLFLFIVNILHDLLYNTIYIIHTELSFWQLLFKYSLSSCLYTVFIGCLIFYGLRR